MHTTGPRPDMSVSAMMSAWQIKMASERRGERREEKEGGSERGGEERWEGDRLGMKTEGDRDRKG